MAISCEGGYLVTNYVDGVGASGKFCCTVKEDYQDDFYGSPATHSDYIVAGAIEGTCCGGYTKYITSFMTVLQVMQYV